MRIAYISYEFPPDTAVGGIATYVFQITKTMSLRGHEIEVFCASNYRTSHEIIGTIQVTRILCSDRSAFHLFVLPFFDISNQKRKFDLIESPEFSADGLSVKLKYPQIPLVVKLHTPWFLIGMINNTYLTFYNKAWFIISGLLKAKLYEPFWQPRKKESDPDYLITKIADEIHTPSISLGDIVSNQWHIPRNNIHHLPYPYNADQQLLSIPINTATGRITYVGRLEIRKGLVALGKAIIKIIKLRPGVKFRFVGSIQSSPKKGVDMKAYLIGELQGNADSLEFLEVSSNEIYKIYAETDICVFPSIWENFPNTCLEAMSAGRGIVASSNGGMKDMLADCDGGLLVNPLKKDEIALALLKLIDNPQMRMSLGKNAREKVLRAYNSQLIGELTEQRYQALIN